RRDAAAVAALAEAVDGIRNVLLHPAGKRPPRVVVVTSALGGEGKTLLATHLALSLARAGRRTLLVDCDLRKPSAHGQLGLAAGPGFCEALRRGGACVAESRLRAGEIAARPRVRHGGEPMAPLTLTAVVLAAVTSLAGALILDAG